MTHGRSKRAEPRGSLRASTKALFIAGAAALVVVVALALVWLLPGSSSDAALLKDEMVAAGLDIGKADVEGTTLSVVMTSPAITVENAISESVLGLTLERIAQKAGITFINCVNDAGGERVSGGISISPPQPVTYVSPAVALAAVDAWVAEVANRYGVKVDHDFRDRRLDLTVTGPPKELEPAVETFLAGAFGQHNKGNLDLVTVVAKSEAGQIAFEGVTDCLVSKTVKSWTTSEFDANSF
jgi:hypothetical protein